MRFIALSLAIVSAAATATAEEANICADFEIGPYTTVKQLQIFDTSYCIGWSELPDGEEHPEGQIPLPLYTLKPYKWEVYPVPTGKKNGELTEYHLVFRADYVVAPNKTQYTDVVVHVEPFNVRHTPSANEQASVPSSETVPARTALSNEARPSADWHVRETTTTQLAGIIQNQEFTMSESPSLRDLTPHLATRRAGPEADV